jgi:predicted nuclease of restriction endonuclease-like (RecB) superfamily
MNKNISKNNYTVLILDIGKLFKSGRQKAFQAVNKTLINTYWNIGRRIVEFEQHGEDKAEYGSKLLVDLSKDLKNLYGKGFSRSNLQYMRLFYLKFEKRQTLSGKLNWSHYIELISVSDDLARSFYYNQCINENWSVRELKRQRSSALLC